MQFVDTNIFIRYLTKDDAKKAAACFRLFEQARENHVSLTTSESVIAEVVFILSSKKLYHLSREEISVRLHPVLSLVGLKLPQKHRYFRALELYTNYSIDFEDALSVASMEDQGVYEIYSYDEDFDAIDKDSVCRIEP